MEKIYCGSVVLNDLVFKTAFGKHLFEQLIRKWYSEDQCSTRIQSNYVVDKFLFYKENKMIKSPYDDVSYLLKISLQEIESVLSKIDSLCEVKQKQQSKIIQFENDKMLVVTPLTYEASQKYGGNTLWCVSASQTMAMYDALCTGKRMVYMFCPKNGDDKHILYVNNNNAVEFTDREDNPLTKDYYLAFLKKYEISKEFCSFETTCLREYYYIKPCCFYCSELQQCPLKDIPTELLARRLEANEERTFNK
jgi:hypothetical protein